MSAKRKYWITLIAKNGEDVKTGVWVLTPAEVINLQESIADNYANPSYNQPLKLGFSVYNLRDFAGVKIREA